MLEVLPEFTQEENEIFASLSRRMGRFGLAFVVIGIVGLIEAGISWSGPGYSSIVTKNLIKAGYYILTGGIIWLPSANFKKIVTAKGNDITEVLDAVKKLAAGFGFVQVLQIFNVIVVLLDIGNVL